MCFVGLRWKRLKNCKYQYEFELYWQSIQQYLKSAVHTFLQRDHPFKTSAFFRGRGVKNWPNLPTDSSKKLPTGGGRGQKSWKIADVLNGWSLIATFLNWWGNPIWSSLIDFGRIWSKKIKNKTAIFILSVNVATFNSNTFLIGEKSNLIKFDQVWSILDGSDPKKSKLKQPFLSFL